MTSLDLKMVENKGGQWVFACKVEDVRPEDVRSWEFDGHSYAIFRSPTGEVFATDNICTHEHALLSDGFVEGNTVECPRHAGRFSYKTGEALGAPVCIALRTYETRVEDGRIEICLRRRA